MLSKSKNVGASQEQDDSWDQLVWFDSLPQEELDRNHRMSSDKAHLPDMQPTVDHSISGSCNEIYTIARRLQLRFSTAITSPVLTGKKIEGEGCRTIKVVLIDGHTGKQVDSGPEAFAEVEIVVLSEAFASVRDDDWTIEEFDKNIVTVWKCKKFAERKKLKLILKLKEGCGILDELCFTHDRNWSSKAKLRLGARIVDDLNRTRVREAKTEPFELKDSRLECNRKHYPPSLLDGVWRLDKIARDGSRHKSLRDANINTVKDFLILRFLDPRKLREKYGVCGKNLDDTVKHALTCPDKMVCYSSSSSKQTGVVVNASVEVLGLLSEGKFIHVNKLSDANKANAHKSVKSAFECPENVDCFNNAEDHSPIGPNVSDFPTSHDFWTRDKIGHHYDHNQPSTSTQDTVPAYSTNFYSPQESITEQVPNYQMDDEALYNLCCSYDDDIHNDFHGSYGFESHNANQTNSTNESTSVQAGASPFGRAHKRWKKFSKVWSGAWFFIKKMGVASVHAKKKLRICYE